MSTPRSQYVRRYGLKLKRPRTGACSDCGRTWSEVVLGGNFPARCPECDPRGAFMREASRRWAIMVSTCGPTPDPERVSRLTKDIQHAVDLHRVSVVGVGRTELRSAVLRVANARGHLPTAAALRNLAAIAIEWSARIEANVQSDSNVNRRIDESLKAIDDASKDAA